METVARLTSLLDQSLNALDPFRDNLSFNLHPGRGSYKTLKLRHPVESRGPEIVESRRWWDWIPASAGMTRKDFYRRLDSEMIGIKMNNRCSTGNQ